MIFSDPWLRHLALGFRLGCCRLDLRPLVCSIGIAASALLLACGGGPGGGSGDRVSGDRVSETTTDTVVLVVIDTLRADRLPVYGYSRGRTPGLDRLAAEAVVFESAYSPVPLTLPAHTTLLSGRLPPEHGVRDNLGFRVPADLPWLPAELTDAGWATGGFVSARVLGEGTGFERGFERFDAPRGRGDAATPLGGVARSGEETLDQALAWLDGVPGEQPLFLLLHLYEPHAPYDPPEPFASELDDPYDGEVAAADRVLDRLLASLEERGRYRDALVLVTSDHGEGLGDHGESGHGVLLHEEVLRVPLVIKAPGWSGGAAGGAIGGARDRSVAGRAPTAGPVRLRHLAASPVPVGSAAGGHAAAGHAVVGMAGLGHGFVRAGVSRSDGTRSDGTRSGVLRAGAARAGGAAPSNRRRDPVHLMDVYPTVREAAGLGGTAPGRSLLRPERPTEEGESSGDRAPGRAPGSEVAPEITGRALYGETLHPRLAYGWSGLRSLVVGRWHLIDGPAPELYDRWTDPRQRRNLRDRERRVLSALTRRLHEGWGDRAGWQTGALAGPGAGGAITGEAREALAALGYLGGGGADAVAGEGPDPKARLPVLEQLAEAFDRERRGDWRGAAELFDQALTQAPGTIAGWEALARCRQQLGELDGARRAYGQALAVAAEGELSRDLALALAALELDAGRPEAVVSLVETWFGPGSGPAFPEAQASLRSLAYRLATRGEGEPARRVGAAVLRLAPRQPESHELAALVALAADRPERAEEAARRALELGPSRLEAWNLLGVARARRGAVDEALVAWQEGLARAEPGSPAEAPVRLEVLFNLGGEALRSGRPELARQAFGELVVHLGPDHPERARAQGLLEAARRAASVRYTAG